MQKASNAVTTTKTVAVPAQRSFVSVIIFICPHADFRCIQGATVAIFFAPRSRGRDPRKSLTVTLRARKTA